jgi:glycosyltransferase involved in cell wall biosynthesis
MSLVSIIIPAYNGEKFLPRSIGSVLAQTFTDWELIVVDDGSTDGTKKVVEEFIKKDHRIFYYYEENSGGPAKPKNTAWRYVRGEYVAYLDQDDEWLPEKLEKQVALFKESGQDVGLVGCDVFLARDNGKIFGKYTTQRSNVFPTLLERNYIYSNSSVMIRRDTIEKVGSRDECLKYAEDWDMWIRIAKNGYNFAFVSDPLLKYYFHNASTTSFLGDVGKAKDAEYIFKKHYNLYEKFNFLYAGLFRIGALLFLAGNTNKSRKKFIQAIGQKRSFVPAYLGYIISFTGIVGVFLVRCVIFLYRTLHGRTYGLIAGDEREPFENHVHN